MKLCVEHPCLVRKSGFGGFFLADLPERVVIQIISVRVSERNAWHRSAWRLQLAI